ncbi:COA8 family protein CG14806, mitochondrial [Anthonomus grandis grandis]|uniref:COA8 family protein CG14806, mitochondrial n=1 Tax=Anthonomus grandis grandis TaxID=2921223 RepID=UPI0021659857|nr:COA8 family protein CG14806, mitochondrial [Anthonomus grandis grandis]
MSLPLSSLRRAQRYCTVLKPSHRLKSSRAAPRSITLEKSLEEPVIVLNPDTHVDLIGPPDSQSNLRPIIRKILDNETVLQQRFRETADKTQKWNHEFWALHNSNFKKEKAAYIKQHTSDSKPQLNMDEMSEFYKGFLDKYWRTHLSYNFEWYSKNFTLLALAFRVEVERLRHKYLFYPLRAVKWAK